MLLKIFNPRLHIRITFIDKKLSLLSVARAFAIIVFEHPGGPNIRTPCGGEIPSRVKTSGCFKGHSTAWRNFNFSSCCPPMSLHCTYENM